MRCQLSVDKTVNEGVIYFRLVGDTFDPEAITKRLGIQPSRIKRKGNPTPKLTFWELSSEKVTGEVVDVYEIAEPLIRQLQPKAKAIRALVDELQLRALLQVVLWITTDESKSTPAVGFDEKTIQFLSKARGSVDVDIYRS